MFGRGPRRHVLAVQVQAVEEATGERELALQPLDALPPTEAAHGHLEGQRATVAAQCQAPGSKQDHREQGSGNDEEKIALRHNEPPSKKRRKPRRGIATQFPRCALSWQFAGYAEQDEGDTAGLPTLTNHLELPPAPCSLRESAPKPSATPFADLRQHSAPARRHLGKPA